MRRKLSISTLAAAALLLCASQADAQRMRTRVVSAPAGTQVVRASGASASHSSGAASAPVVTQHSRNSVEGLLLGDYPVPGLGFDYTHLAAVNRNLGARALIDPVTQHRLALEREVRRNAPRPVAPAFPVVVNQIVVNVVPQPPVVIVQEPEYERVEPASYRERLERLEGIAGVSPAAAREPEPEPVSFYEPPLREGDELVLIRRDGALLFAVAFTVQPDTAGDARVVYITRAGHRRSVPLAELDLDATRDINEARGTSLHLP